MKMPSAAFCILLFLPLFGAVGASSPTGLWADGAAFENVSADFLTGKHNYYSDPRFIEIPASMAYRSKMFLLRETWDAYKKMYTAATADGIRLRIMSATRTFEEQSWIWEDKWKKDRNTFPSDAELAAHILQFSAMPGTSRHHWGTEIDLNSTSETYFAHGEGAAVYQWLQKHAAEFGFCQTYDDRLEGRPSGYQEEKWHWSYFPVSNILLEKYKERVTYADIHGFSGDAAAVQLRVIPEYVLSVSNSCYY